MDNFQYSDLEKLIKEYQEDSGTIRGERLVMINYPKVFVMSAASSFECQIKKRCEDFINNPKLPLDQNYQKIAKLRNKNKTTVDSMFAKLEAYYSNKGIEILKADKFYDLFNGEAFKNIVISKYKEEKDKYILEINDLINKLKPLHKNNDKYGADYIRQCEVKEELEGCSFDDAEKSYLGLKLRRNRLSHDYIGGISDTFMDLQRFYNKAVVYVMALENSIMELTK